MCGRKIFTTGTGSWFSISSREDGAFAISLANCSSVISGLPHRHRCVPAFGPFHVVDVVGAHWSSSSSIRVLRGHGSAPEITQTASGTTTVAPASSASSVQAMAMMLRIRGSSSRPPGVISGWEKSGIVVCCQSRDLIGFGGREKLNC